MNVTLTLEQVLRAPAVVAARRRVRPRAGHRLVRGVDHNVTIDAFALRGRYPPGHRDAPSVSAALAHAAQRADGALMFNPMPAAASAA